MYGYVVKSLVIIIYHTRNQLASKVIPSSTHSYNNNNNNNNNI